MIAASFSGTDVWMLVAIVVLLLILAFLAMAETALNRISKVKAQAIADSVGSRSARQLARLAHHPERFINALLVTITICQTAQAFLTSILADRLFGTVGLIVAFVLNVVVFFVLAEAVPKTYAVLYPQKAALATARPVSALVAFPPLRLISRWVRAHGNKKAAARMLGLSRRALYRRLERLDLGDTIMRRRDSTLEAVSA